MAVVGRGLVKGLPASAVMFIRVAGASYMADFHQGRRPKRARCVRHKTGSKQVGTNGLHAKATFVHMQVRAGRFRRTPCDADNCILTFLCGGVLGPPEIIS